MASEEDFLTLLIASERVENWLSAIRGGGFKAKQAVKELAEALQSEAYAEEARRAGAVPLLTGLLKRTDDEELLDACSDALAACSGLMATSGKVRTFLYGGIPVVLKEGALGDGVGAKLWTCSHSFCREMVSHPEIVHSKTVLEIGAGCGACGILAAKLGATRVVLTDYVGAVLLNLRDCMHLNSNDSSGDGGSSSGDPGSDPCAAARGTAVAGHLGEGQPDDWDPEDASECGSEDFDALLSDALAPAAKGGSQRQQPAAWDAPPMHVRFYDWQHSVDRLSEQERAQLAATPGLAAGVAAASMPGATIDSASNECGAPGMDEDEVFDVVLGTEILYEWQMVEMVAAVIKCRLRRGGRALLCCAVREQAMFDAFAVALATLGLRVGITPVQPAADDMLDIRQEYEGGYVLIAVEHTDAPAEDWHRDDLFGQR